MNSLLILVIGVRNNYFRIVLFFLIFSWGLMAKKDLEIYGGFEYGVLAFLNHSIQFGEENQEIDYRSQGGQNILFPNWRLALGSKFLKNHRLQFTYQPIFVQTTSVIPEDMTVDNVNFSKNEGVEFKYDFPFYRLHYTYDFISKEKLSIELGAGLQLRNAFISFESSSKSKTFATNSLGPVPLLVFVYSQKFDNDLKLYADALGFWAPIRYLNGGKTDIEGWIYESSIELSYKIAKHFSPFVNLRLIGGGNKGKSEKYRSTGGNHSKNIINTLSLNFGLNAYY